MIERAITVERLGDGREKRQRNVKEYRGSRKDEGVGNARPQDIGNWAPAAQRHAKIAVNHIAEPQEIALKRRPVEMKLLAQHCARLFARELAEHVARDI